MAHRVGDASRGRRIAWATHRVGTHRVGDASRRPYMAM